MQKKSKDMRGEDFKIALVLGSGGAKGFAHIGVLKAFEEAGIKFDIITGCSMGAIIGSCYALGIDSKKLEERVMDLTMREIIDLKIPNTYGFIKGNKAEKLIRELLDAKSTEPQFSDCNIKFGCVASDIAQAQLVNLTSGDLIPAVRASFSICGVFRPVKIDGRDLLDGGVFSRVPVDLAKELGADVVIAVDCIGETKPETLDNFKYFDTISRIFNIMDYQISKPEMERADYLISLNQPTISAIKVKNVPESIEVGYKTTKSKMKEIKQIIKNKRGEKYGK